MSKPFMSRVTDIEGRWPLWMAASLLIPALILFKRPLGMDSTQSAVVSSLLLIITWWSAGIVKKSVASCILLLIFALTKAAPLATIFTFPLSENFFLIILTYLFSQGIENSGLVDKLFEPFLLRFARTPAKALAAIIAMYIATIYMIPQPLARLIIVAMLFFRFLSKTTATKETKSVLMFGCFVFYAVVNMGTKNADIIMNTASVAFAGLDMSDGEWIRYMALPVAVYCLLIFGAFCLIFRKHLFGIGLSRIEGEGPPRASASLTKKEKTTLLVVILTIIAWMTEDLHGINATLITSGSVALFFLQGTLRLKDLKAIDVRTMIFLTAAFSIGGVMKACGAAEIVFSRLAFLFPSEYSLYYLAVMMLVAMLMHMVLGSNTTTLSVVIPGLIVICGNVLPPQVIMFISYNSVASHSILPFHSAAIMIGASYGYFPNSYVARLGIPVTLIIILSAAFVFVPWWNFLGVL